MSSAVSYVSIGDGVVAIDVASANCRNLNCLLKELAANNMRRVEMHNVHGQRYIGTGLKRGMEIEIHGTPGNDLGAFMDGPSITVYGNVQDGCGNTMNDGMIIVHGQTGDVTGYSMRGGKIFIRDNVGYRAGIHMKAFEDKRPFLVIGGRAGDFLGEYMAGGVIILLGLDIPSGEEHATKFVGTGMHGGVIYVRGEVAHLGAEGEATDADEHDIEQIKALVKEFCSHFGYSLNRIMKGKFTKVFPVSRRPYRKLYAI